MKVLAKSNHSTETCMCKCYGKNCVKVFVKINTSIESGFRYYLKYSTID